MKNLIAICVCFIFFFSCKKEKESPVTSPTSPPPSTTPTIDSCSEYAMYKYLKLTQSPTISYPMANPNNPDEFAFLVYDMASDCCGGNLMVFNLGTKELRRIIQKNISTYEWGNQDWIIFQEYPSYTAFKIRPSGNELTPIFENTIIPGFISFNSYGDKFIHTYCPPSPSIICGLGVLNLNGEILKMLKFSPGGEIVWHKDSILTEVSGRYHDQVSFALHNINNFSDDPFSSVVAITSITNAEGLTYFDWIDDTTMLFSSPKGLFTVDFSNFENPAKPVQIWEQGCMNTLSTMFAIVKDTKKIITIKNDFDITSDSTVSVFNHLVIMNFDGTDLETIEIPELY